MKWVQHSLAIVCACMITAIASVISAAAAPPPTGSANFGDLIASLRPTIADDFDGPEGQGPNLALWNVETGGGGWGNKEKQVFTADAENLRLDGQGHLIMEAREDFGVITSSRLNTFGHASLDNGVFAVRMQMPAGQGMHSGAWMLGDSWKSAGYPGCGEIDVVELVNDPNLAHFTLHGPWGDGRTPGWQVGRNVPTADLSDDFHTYWVHKEPGRVTFGIDGPALATIDTAALPPDAQWAQDSPFFALLSLSVGGGWPGDLAPGVLPQQMVVDWVRFYQ